MAAFCTCCGAAITLKSVACSACGAPSHGMSMQTARIALQVKETPFAADPDAIQDKPVRQRMVANCCTAA